MPAAPVQVAAPRALGPEDVELAAQLQDFGVLQRVADMLRLRVVVPRAVQLRFASCASANAWYQPEAREVQVCLSLARQLAERLSLELEDEAQLLQALDGALRFIALHELGHALVDVLQLPITGREEDAVDQFAVWLLLGGGDSAAVLSAASLFGGEISGAGDLAGTHSLDRQRYFNMLCWVYGADADARGSLLDDWALPVERAAGCAEEYAQLGRSWQRLLAAHAPPPVSAAAPDAPARPAVANSDSTQIKPPSGASGPPRP